MLEEISPLESDERSRALESARLAVLESYRILDTAPEEAFDDLVNIAAEICDAPMALMSLVDSTRQWFKAAIGINLPHTPREGGFCAHAITQEGVLLIEDVRKDPMFSNHPMVTGDPELRFYAGMPLVTPEGFAIGTLCVLDSQPRSLSKTQLLALQALGRQVMTQMELRKALAAKRADDERNRVSEEGLRRAEEVGGVGLFNVDLLTNQVTGSPHFFRIFGLSSIAPVAATVLEALVDPLDLKELSAGKLLGSDRAPLDVEYRVNRADTGETRWIARYAKYESASDGTPVRVVGIVRDVTERRVAQRAAEESAAQFSVLAQAQPNHAWTSPPDGQLDWFNNRVYEYSGFKPGELDGNGWTIMVHEEDLTAAGANWAASLASGQIYETEFRLRRADGVYRWHLARALPILSADGRVSRWVGTNTDIHERKLSAEKSTEDRDRIWSLSQELMLVCDFDGVITDVNPSAKRLLGFSEEEMIGKAIVQFIHPDDLLSTAAEGAKLSQGNPTLAFENRYRAKDGSYRVLAWTAVPEGDRIHGVARDMTRERLAEEALRQSQKMEAVGQLTGGVAHDFNNILQGITGSLDLLKKKVSQGKIEEIDRFINGAMSSAKRAAALTHRLLAFSRRQPLDPKAVHANPLLTSMEDLLRRTIGERVKLEIVMAGGLWLTRCDPNQLESSVLNLVINARDAMPDGGTLTIETGNAYLDNAYVSLQIDLKPGQYVCISVSDTGSGMSADTVSKAFEPFFTTKPIGQGTGLGLSMIYGFAKQSSGYAKIYSEVGKGTTVKVYLPRYRGPADTFEPLPELAEAHRAGENETVLVVEDEPVVRALIVEVLKELGYRTLQASDGSAGLSILETSRRIDLLISDIGLPGINGRQMAEAARQLRPKLKVLYMTGYAENAAISSGFLESGMSIITKPFAIEALATRICEMLKDS